MNQSSQDRADLMPEKSLVVGLGISGLSVCELLLRHGRRVVATDLRSREQFGPAVNRLEEQGCLLRLGAHRPEDFLAVDQIVVSPGVPLDLGPLKAAAAKGIEIVGELEWAWRRVSTPVVAVTGTNGKTTTTSLIGEMLKAAGRRVFVGGNIGTPLSRWLLDGGDAEFLVLEVSSFQLDTAPRFRPDVGLLLNVTEDHLDRYENFKAYADSKFSLFKRQRESDVGILNLDDPLCRARRSDVPGRLLTTSRKDGEAHASLRGREIRVAFPGEAPFELSLERAKLQGVHNEENILAATLAAAACNAPASAIQQTIDSYRGLPHRVEWVRTWRGIDFFDDSKGTNVGAVVKALENFDRPVWLFLGGRDKLGSYEPLARLLQEKGKGALVYGEAAPRLYKELEKFVPTRSFPDLQSAFEDAVSRAAPGDVMLLSPACSSFDQYSSYAERGNHFKRLAAQLNDECGMMKRQ